MQAPLPAEKSNPYLSVHAVSIFVRDQEQSRIFYVEQLGFDIAFDAHLQSGDRWLAVSPPDGSAVLALVTPKPNSREVNMIGRDTGIVFVSDNVVAQYADWRKKGVRFRYAPRLRRVDYDLPDKKERDSIWGGVFTHFIDVDGNSFALIGFDHVTRQIDAQRRAHAEKQETERRAAQELEIAKQVQARLFPQTLPDIPTLEYAGTCIQARKVGGDYYDFIEFGGRRYGLVLGDIAGKGIAAALLMANLQANVRIQCALCVDQPLLLNSVNRAFLQNSDESSYATLFFAEYNDETRRLRYTNCGHLPGLLLRRDGVIERLASTGTVLGLFKDWDAQPDDQVLSPGDLLAIYTDGITEASDDADLEFGEGRLTEALRQHRDLPAKQIVEAIVGQVQKFGVAEQHDDITLIVAKSL
jgi:serine phosphatase RsbU (regulator of sigma subunit)